MSLFESYSRMLRSGCKLDSEDGATWEPNAMSIARRRFTMRRGFARSTPKYWSGLDLVRPDTLEEPDNADLFLWRRLMMPCSQCPAMLTSRAAPPYIMVAEKPRRNHHDPRHYGKMEAGLT